MNVHFFACLLCSSGCEPNHLILVLRETVAYFFPLTLNVWEGDRDSRKQALLPQSVIETRSNLGRGFDSFGKNLAFR